MAIRNGVTVRGTSNGNERGSAEDRRRRKNWLLETYPANFRLIKLTYSGGKVIVDQFVEGVDRLKTHDYVEDAVELPSCRCYRCGRLLWFGTLTVDRITPGCKGGTYRRTNIRPACEDCNSETGGGMATGRAHQPAKRAARRKAARKGSGRARELESVS